MPVLLGFADRPARPDDSHHQDPHPPDRPGSALENPAATAADRELWRSARRVLRQNRTGASTVPSRSLYPHQWSWDSAFIAIGLRHDEPARARMELETLFAAQWRDGRVPHIAFSPRVPHSAYFPSPDFWRSSTAGGPAGAPTDRQTSGIVQPPVHALAAWLVHRADPTGSVRAGFLRRLYPRLTAWQRYLAEDRDLGGLGLAAVVHPWESGMDNSPCWDEPLARITPAAPDSFRRADLDHGTPADRPTDEDYGRYVALAAGYRDRRYTDREPHPFAVADPGFNALLIAAELALGEIAIELAAEATGERPAGAGQPNGPDALAATSAAELHARAARHRSRARRRTRALVQRLWSDSTGQFHCRDLVGGRTLATRGATGLLPLLLPGLPPPQTAALLRTLSGAHFGLGSTTALVPSHDLLGPEFHRGRYWRGPAWFNINWLIERGLRQHGERARADALRGSILTAAGASGFAEYLDPYTQEPHGARAFSWTAALAMDLLATGPAGQAEDEDRAAGTGHPAEREGARP